MKNILTSCVLLIVFLTSCGLLKENPKPKTTATVVTDEISNITATGATVAGEVVTDGNTTVTERGFAYGTAMNPTFEVGKVSAGAGEGVFTADLTALTPGTLYHVRAYAINSKGVGYGDDRTFTTTVAVPTLTTTAATSITAISASTGGTITSDGGSAVTARGVCWNTTGNPTTADTKTTDGSGTGSFTSSPTGFKSNGKIYIRAYATNSIGTAYGNQVEVTTLKAVPSNGLVGWWPFNGNANDESGNGNNASLTSSSFILDRFDFTERAIQLKGIDGLGSVTNLNTQLNGLELSISLWLKFPQQWSYSSLALVKNGISYANGFNVAIDQNDSAYGIGNYAVIFLVGNGSAATFISNQGELGEWVNLACSYDGNSVKIYLNGSLKQSVPYNQNLNFINNSLVFGYWDNVSTPSITERNMDDIAIFNRALTADEVLKIYNGTGF